MIDPQKPTPWTVARTDSVDPLRVLSDFVSMAEPLPFRLPIPGTDSVSIEGVASVSYKVYGLLHVTEHGIELEWSGIKTTEHVGFVNLGTQVDDVPLDWREVPVTDLKSARLSGGWWRPRLELRVRYIDTFEGVPSARGVVLRLRIARRDRGLAKEVVQEIEELLANMQVAHEDPTLLEDSGSNW